MPAFIYLAIAIVAEVIATLTLPATKELTRPVQTAVVFIGYSVAFYFMTLAIRQIPIGITYAVWSGLGIVSITIISYFLYGQKLNYKISFGIFLIVAGVIIISIFKEQNIKL